MSRPRKGSRRDKGIHAKSGYLYIVKSETTIIDGCPMTKKKWISTGLKDTRENVKLAADYRNKLARRRIILEDPNITLSEYIDKVLVRMKRELADTTFATYSYRGKRIKRFFNGRLVKDLQKKEVESFLDYLFQTCHLQPGSVKDTKRFLCTILDCAIDDGLITENVARDTKISKPLSAMYTKSKNPDDFFFSYDEATLFLSYVEDEILYTLFFFTLFFGLRKEEALGLQWSSIILDGEEPYFFINHTVTIGTKVNRLNTTKTDDSKRSYPLMPDQVQLLKHIKEQERLNRIELGDCYSNNDYVFKHKDGTPFSPWYPTKIFKKILRKHPELPQQISFRNLRTSCVSMLVHENKDVKSIQKWVGHKNYDTTMRYYAIAKDKEAKKDISENMANLLPVRKIWEEK